MQEPKLLGRKLKVHGGDAGDVTAWSVEAGDETSLDGVSPFEAFLPLVRVMGKLEIEPIELR